jgi:hypothetical protein
MTTTAQASRRYYAKNRERRNAESRAYYHLHKAENRERDSAYAKRRHAEHREERCAATRKWYWANREKARAYKRSDRYKAYYWEKNLGKFGLTLDSYHALLEKQGDKCACCGTSYHGGRQFNVDHDHETGKVRGLLCNRCNLGLGYLDDNLAGVQRAMAYLERTAI